MKEGEIEKSPFLTIGQVGVVVKDLDKFIEFYSSLGIGPFKPSDMAPTIERKVRGKVANYKTKMRVAQVGQVELEVSQPLGGECAQREFLESKGEGINHLGFFVDDLDKEVAKLTERGFKVIQSGRNAKGNKFAYFDTTAIGGIILELIQREWE